MNRISPLATSRSQSADSHHYHLDHLVAKTLVCVAVITFGSIGIHTGNSYISLVPGTLIWFFGVNSLGYLLECLMHHPHCHNLF